MNALTCRWAELGLYDSYPVWLSRHDRQWYCLRSDVPRFVCEHECTDCPRWESRLHAVPSTAIELAPLDVDTAHRSLRAPARIRRWTGSPNQGRRAS
jgi:hypothetical protein